MKNSIKICLILVAVVFGFNSCSTDDKVVDDVLNGVTNGGVLRTLNQPENNDPLTSGIGNTYTIDIEEQDNQDGDLMQEVRVYVRFNDNTILGANSASGAGSDESFPADGSDVLLRTLSPADFTDGPFGLPRTSINITEADLGAVLPSAEFDTEDTVTVRLELELTDGRIFSDFNAGGIITGGFFSSPFLYTINLDSGIGINYLSENRNSYVVVAGFDNTYAVEAELTDQASGANIASLNVYRRFVDNTPENGDNSTMEELMQTFTTADFTTGPNGFPVVDVTITEAETLGALTAADITISDEFFVRYEIMTVDGRTATNEVVESDFYDSVLVTDCPFPALDETASFTGDYLIEQITQSIFGYDTFDPDGGGVVVTLFSEVLDASQFSAGTVINDNQRSFDADYLAPLGGLNFRSHVMEFNICEVTISEGMGPIGDFTGWACGGVSIIISSAEGGSYNAADDAEFVMKFTDDINDACGFAGAVQPELRFVKQ